MSRTRINPHKQGTAEHVLFARARKAQLAADHAANWARHWQAEADAEQAKADSYTRALAEITKPAPLQIAGPK